MRCNRVETIVRHSQPNPYFRVIWIDNPNNPKLVSNPTRSVKYGLDCRVVLFFFLFYFYFVTKNGGERRECEREDQSSKREVDDEIVREKNRTH